MPGDSPMTLPVVQHQRGSWNRVSTRSLRTGLASEIVEEL
jgi:hypothetical protein